MARVIRRRLRFGTRMESLEARHLLAADPIISEFLASNQAVLVDGNDTTPDWIEIYNAGDEAIDLAGWYLTDDPNATAKWKFPDTVAAELDAEEYLVVFASGDNEPDADGNLHTNFKLSAGGDYLALLSPEQSTVSQFGTFDTDYPEQFEDVSYGIAADGNVGYFLTPTPGEANSQAVDGFVADTKFSVDRGFFNEPFLVDITSSTLGATMVYTIDGTEPTLSNGTQVTSAVDSFPTATVAVDTTMTLRAAAFKTDFEPTNVDTQTYLFLDDVIQQSNRPAGFPTQWGSAPAADYEMDPQIVDDPAYTQDLLAGLRELPTLSVATDVDNIFGSRGIYTNPQNDSREAPISAEWILPDGTTGFQIDAGLKVSGGASRSPNNSPKHSMSLRFRSEYGAGRLNHELFPSSPVDSFNSLQLRAMYNNSWIHWNSDQQHRGTLIRDQFIRDSLLAMGQADAGHGTYVHLYLNGLYWGVYNVHERHDSAHYSEYHGGSADDYDALNGGSANDGNLTSYNRMRRTVASKDWEAVQAVLDVDNFIDWTIAQAYGGNEDLKLDGNWRAAGGGSGDGKWRIYAWDSERILEAVTARPPGTMLDPMQIRDDLVQIPEFRLRFGDRLQKHFANGGALTPEAVASRWNARVAELANAIVAESARWGDYRRDVHQRGNDIDLYERDAHWLPEHERLNQDYFPARSSFILEQYRSLGLYPEVNAPHFEVNDQTQHGGVIQANSDTIGFAAGQDQVVVTEAMVLIGNDSPALAFVPSDDSLETGPGPFWYDESFVAENWTAGTNGVGYENSTNGAYRDLLGTDVGPEWNANRTSLYARFEFNLGEEFTTYDRMQLDMTFDDGFVAYLNGQLIDVDPNGNSNLAPSVVRWNSASIGDDRPDSVVLSSPLTYDLTPHISLLHSGSNVLAIHGLSNSAGSSDMLMRPALLLQKTARVLPTIYFTVDGSDPRAPTGVPSGNLFTDPFTISESTNVRARVLAGSDWSALLEADFAVESLLGDIDGNRTVDFADFLILSRNFGKQLSDDPLDGDLDGDGNVGFSDFLILAANFGKRS